MKVKLTKGLKSYHGAVTATQADPIVDVPAKQAERLIAAGWFTACEEPKKVRKKEVAEDGGETVGDTGGTEGVHGTPTGEGQV